MFTKIAMRILLPAIVAFAVMPAQTKSNFNGVWKMDPARSEFGTGPVSESRLDRIVIDGVHMKDTITQKLHHGQENTYDMIYTLDGKECSNQVRGNRVKSTAQMDGDQLVVDSEVFTLRKAIMKDRYAISPDGKTMTLLRHMTGAFDTDQKITFDRQQ